MIESDIGFNGSELDKYSQYLIRMAQRDNPKEVKKFMRKEGRKLKTCVMRNVRQRTKPKTGNYRKSIKRGIPYRHDGADAIRVYSTAPHSHLIEDPHRIVSHGTDTGKTSKGKKIFRDAKTEFAPTYEHDVDTFIEDFSQRVEK